MKNAPLYTAIVALVVALAALVLDFNQPAQVVGGTNYNRMIDFAEGLSVNGTTVLSAARALTVAGITNTKSMTSAATSTFSAQVGIDKCLTVKSTYGSTIYVTFATSTGDGTIKATSTRPTDCNTP